MLFLAILLFTLFASVFTFSKEALHYAEPFFFVGSRMSFAGLLLLTHQAVFNRQAFGNIKALHVTPLFLLGFFNIYITNISEIWGLDNMISSKVCLIYSLTPFVAALIAYLVLKETLSKKKWIGMLIGFVGLIPIFSMQTASEIATGQFLFLSFAELTVIIAVVTSVYGWILLKKLITHYNYSFVLANGISMLLGGCLALLHAYFSGESFTPLPVIEFGPFLINMLIVCLISNVICYNLYGYLLRYFTATFMSFAGLVSPFFASLYGWVFLGEQISWHFYVSMALFSIGLIIFYQEEIKKGEAFKKIQSEQAD